MKPKTSDMTPKEEFLYGLLSKGMAALCYSQPIFTDRGHTSPHRIADIDNRSCMNLRVVIG